MTKETVPKERCAWKRKRSRTPRQSAARSARRRSTSRATSTSGPSDDDATSPHRRDGRPLPERRHRPCRRRRPPPTTVTVTVEDVRGAGDEDDSDNTGLWGLLGLSALGLAELQARRRTATTPGGAIYRTDRAPEGAEDSETTDPDLHLRPSWQAGRAVGSGGDHLRPLRMPQLTETRREQLPAVPGHRPDAGDFRRNQEGHGNQDRERPSPPGNRRWHSCSRAYTPAPRSLDPARRAPGGPTPQAGSGALATSDPAGTGRGASPSDNGRL